MDYGAIISRAWRITWNNKFLWVLGFLAALGSVGSNSGYRSSVQSGSDEFSPEQIIGIASLVIAVICFALLLGLVIWLVSLVSRGGLISAAARLDAGESVTLGEAFGAGTNAIGRLVGVTIMLYAPFILVGLLAFFLAIVGGGVAAFGAMEADNLDLLFQRMGVVAIVFVCLACLLIPFVLLINLIHPFALRGTMLQQLGVVDSIRHGWRILRDNFGDILLLAILFFVINLVFGFAIAIVMLPLALVALAPMFAAGQFGSLGAMEVIWMVGSGLCLGLFGAALQSILTTWQSTSFTLAYLEFVDRDKVKAIP